MPLSQGGCARWAESGISLSLSETFKVRKTCFQGHLKAPGCNLLSTPPITPRVHPLIVPINPIRCVVSLSQYPIPPALRHPALVPVFLLQLPAPLAPSHARPFVSSAFAQVAPVSLLFFRLAHYSVMMSTPAHNVNCKLQIVITTLAHYDKATRKLQ